MFKNRKNSIKTSFGDKTFTVLNTIFMLFIIVVTVYPMYYVLMVSLSDSNLIAANSNLIVKPLGFTFDAYKAVFKNPGVMTGYRNTLFVLAAGLFVNLLLTSIAAYFFSRKNVKLQKPLWLLVLFTMYFSGGTIPFYFTVLDLGLRDNLLALVLPTAINTFNLIILRNAFASIPENLEEAVKLDGGSHFTMLFKVILPLSKSAMAVMVMYYAVQHWNSWFNAMLFLDTRELFPLQLILREILIVGDTSNMTQNVASADMANLSVSLKYAVIIVATLPILAIYPFMQKYFVKGVMVGSVKG